MPFASGFKSFAPSLLLCFIHGGAGKWCKCTETHAEKEILISCCRFCFENASLFGRNITECTCNQGFFNAVAFKRLLGLIRASDSRKLALFLPCGLKFKQVRLNFIQAFLC